MRFFAFYIFIIIRILGGILYALLIVSAAHASAWTRADNEILIISTSGLHQGDLTAVNGDFIGQFRQLRNNNYVEYGISDRLMIGGKVF